MQLSSVRAVITGGVSGLGLAVTQHLVAQGGKVALFDLNDDKGRCRRHRTGCRQGPLFQRQRQR